ncbi:hypothetical protein [Hydrogenophaga sp. T2]|uniref:RIFT barrel domain-containing protein n=1 Tax=Hydrogenophaga sp. T2 TaxID=3132823 RepID=UPI003CE88C6B
MSAGSAQTSVPVTFGQPFRRGDWSNTQGLVARDAAGNTVPLQADEISTHSDGSVRFAVLSAQLNNLAANTPRIVNFYTAAKTAPSVTLPAAPNWNLKVTATLSDGSVLTADPQAQLVQQIASGSNRRLHGPVASEFTVVAPMMRANGTAHPHLVARLHTRLYDNGTRFRTDVVMENTRTFTASPSNITYSLNVTANGSTLLSQPSFTHYHHARWHKVVWSGGVNPNARVRHHMPYFLASRATWNYNLGLKIPETTLANEAKYLASAQTGPMQPALLDTNFPGTGGRPEIAPVPRWTALYLITQDDRARASMLANADAAAGVPIHYRDENTGHPVSIDGANANLSLKYGTSSPAVPAGIGSTIWEPDGAHQGSFSYIPYLVTGDAFYLEEAMFWAGWNIAAADPYYRDGGKGIIKAEQVRGQSWGLRSMAEVAFALPDAHPKKAYYRTIFNNNLSWFADTYGKFTAPWISPMGAVVSQYNNDQSPSYESDFMTIVLSWLSENGEAPATTALTNIARMQVDRFMAESQGFCTAKAPGYWLNVKNASGAYVTTWRDYYTLNYGAPPSSCAGVAVEGYPDWGAGYAAVARAMLGSAANAGVANAAAAYTRWVGFTPLIDTGSAGFLTEPQYAIVPR